jgi:phosphate transport system protein
MSASPEYTKIAEDTVRAYLAAERAATQLAECMSGTSHLGVRAVQEAERELDRIDREIDSLITPAIVQADSTQARELLSSLKMVIDLERVADLFASVAGCVRPLGSRISVEDLGDLVKMASVIEKMLADAYGAFAVRNINRAVAVLRTDAEVDRLRNVILLRHLEQATTSSIQVGVQVLFMAQSLERAGDHVKNLAEEICHLVTGQTHRHVQQAAPAAQEQIPLEYADNARGKAASAAAAPAPLVRGES